MGYVICEKWFESQSLGPTLKSSATIAGTVIATLIAAGKPVPRQSAGHLTVETADSVHRMACAIVWPNTYPE
ncbi:MAG TPA: hypothetical protein VMW72_09700 [Sedimentisphaerales bacterium]|nr:hypothetical protein [Sedimentisphaerales bacterium]